MIVGFPHRPPLTGGPGSFQTRLSRRLIERGIEVVYPEDDIFPDIILVVGATTKLFWLFKCKKKGVKIVYRLDGLKWRHRFYKCGFKNRILPVIQDYIKRFIRYYFADFVIYQSDFIKNWWHEKYGIAGTDEAVIYNAVDLKEFFPRHNAFDKINLICVEGTIPSVDAYVKVVNETALNLYERKVIDKCVICGKVTGGNAHDVFGKNSAIDYLGIVPRESMPDVYKNKVFLVLEVQPPCPNSVIEALASGVPVIGFDTGCLRELVRDGAGVLVSYGSDPWKLEYPDVDELCRQAEKVFLNWKDFSANARKVAEKYFDLDRMTDKYIEVFDKVILK